MSSKSNLEDEDKGEETLSFTVPKESQEDVNGGETIYDAGEGYIRSITSEKDTEYTGEGGDMNVLRKRAKQNHLSLRWVKPLLVQQY